MTFRPNDTPVQAIKRPGRRRVWSVIYPCLSAILALAVGGCVTVPHQPDQQPPPETAAGSRNDSKLVSGDHVRVSDPKIEFQERATDRQKFQVHIDFGRVFETQGNIDAAIHEYQDALAVVESKRRGTLHAADEALAHRRIGGAMDRLGRFAQAETHYKKALKLSPKDPKIWNDAGYSYYLQQRWDEATRALKTAAHLSPDDERVRTNLGLTLAASGRSDEALKLLSQSNGDAIGHANLGYLLAASGQVDLARRQYEQALTLRPDLQLARRALARLDLQQRNPGTAAAPGPLMAQGERTTIRLTDSEITQASMRKSNIPPPTPGELIPVARAARMMADQADRSRSSPGTDDLPPPPPL